MATDELAQAANSDEVWDLIRDEGLKAYEARETELGADTLRAVERQVMLRIIDQRWREHLYEMDHLREGIHLRAMGQRDPTTEWQREAIQPLRELTNLLTVVFFRLLCGFQELKGGRH